MGSNDDDVGFKRKVVQEEFYLPVIAHGGVNLLAKLGITRFFEISILFLQ